MNCPKCGVGKLSPETIRLDEVYRDRVLRGEGVIKEITVNQCFVCNGIWFEAGELEEIIKDKVTILHSDSIDPALYKEFDTKIAKCPECNVDMVKKKAPSDDKVTCEYCEKCHGIWLDGGEIDEIEKHNIKLSDRFKLFLDGVLNR